MPPAEVDAFFQTIAETVTATVARQVPQPAPPVFDGPQDATATAWSALAVHPMSVLETEYVNVVRDAERRGGNDPDRARENGFEAMTRFFGLSSGDPTLLDPDSEPLVADRMKDLAARLDLVRSLAGTDAAAARNELTEVVEDAADLIARLTSADELPFAGDGVQAAAAYLGMFAIPADQAANRWVAGHRGNPDIAALIDEVAARLVGPLCAAGNAMASARSLYNIAPFYLFRLMHRFLGGDQAAEMNLQAKGLASGEATKAMHPPGWAWLTGWHEAQVVALKDRLRALDQTLRDTFGVQDEVIRFFLKGGRAMFTALGQPQRGENDWDTGILINPDLPPDQWYRAFALVNDTVVSFLDRARFSYSALLARHANELAAPPLAALAQRPAPAEPPRYFSRLALIADHEAERQDPRLRTARPARTAAAGGRLARAALVARPRVRSVGVNGELIDIGISKRNSVELMEHWHGVEIVDRRGVTADGIPVPTLPYFVDDFSTIIREALGNGTADRKLAKRLLRLKLVLDSADPDLVAAAREADLVARAALPQAARALGAGPDGSAARMAAWALARLVASVPCGDLCPSFRQALDQTIAAQAQALTNPAIVDAVWRQVEDALPEVARAACHAILILQNAASTLSRRIVQDGVTLAQAIGGPGLPQTNLSPAVQRAVESVMALNGHGATLYVTGGLAGQLQTAHAGLDVNDFLALCPDGIVELRYRQEGGGRPFDAGFMVNRLSSLPPADGLVASVVHDTEGPAVALRLNRPLGGTSVADPTPTVLLLRPEMAGPAMARTLDHLKSWPVASTRDLVRQFQSRAAHSPDLDLRQARRAAAVFLLDEVLGRQLG